MCFNTVFCIQVESLRIQLQTTEKNTIDYASQKLLDIIAHRLSTFNCSLTHSNASWCGHQQSRCSSSLTSLPSCQWPDTA